MKQFNLEAAKNGAKICTRDGRPVRIICFDCIDKNYPIVALVSNGRIEDPYSYTENGSYLIDGTKHASDLMIVTISSATEKYKDYQFEPFEKVLVRISNTSSWQCSFYSHKGEYGHQTCDNNAWLYCLPYNEETKHLLGTNNNEL